MGIDIIHREEPVVPKLCSPISSGKIQSLPARPNLFSTLYSAMATNLSSLLKYIDFTNRFRLVLRRGQVKGEEREENDLEHSGQLGLVTMYLNDALELGLDLELLLKFSLAHDLVEVYAGDVPFTASQEILNQKSTKEHAAAEQIKQEFPEHPELHAAIKEYEERTAPEAKFVYAVDKMLPAVNAYLDDGRAIKRDNISLATIRTKDAKIAIAPEVSELWLEFIKLLEAEHDRIFLKR
jgi:putative hydrolase of HD superfamily